MQIRLRLVAAVAVACSGGLAAVSSGGAQVELLQCLDEIPTIVGTHGDDVLIGTVGTDVISGRSGDDVIVGSWGNDVICGGDGNDRITSSPALFETDLVSGDAGDDVIVAGALATVVYALAPGPVTIDLARGTSTGWGNDTLEGVQRVVGTPFPDVLLGSFRVEFLDGLAGDDIVHGHDGDDSLYGGAGNDSLDGGAGVDLVSFRYSDRAVRVNLARGTAGGEGGDRLIALEHVTGSSFADTLTGDAGTNDLRGEGGTDRLAGGPGTDRLDGGPGRDRVDGGVGRDRCLSAERRSRCP
jgi:Ca2+-binding RTX toxin-like protein